MQMKCTREDSPIEGSCVRMCGVSRIRGRLVRPARATLPYAYNNQLVVEVRRCILEDEWVAPVRDNPSLGHHAAPCCNTVCGPRSVTTSIASTTVTETSVALQNRSDI